MTAKKLERFGKYLVLDHLADGGMAKIFRARFLGEVSNKIVAIKVIQPQFSQDPNFRKMFYDETKAVFGLIHPNIAQTYDYGEIDEQLYTAMEYIDGKNLKQYIDRANQLNRSIPIEICCYVISQACLGLSYAHNFVDKLSGKTYNMIHRDISPHNIMLTYDGAVKVIDFGIAKSDTNSEATQAGTIKGKISYIAPEYLINGIDLDHRYDMFALGITFWEMLCTRKLFQAKNDLATLKLIQDCKVDAPSKYNPTILHYKELDAIVLKSLSKDRNNRYKDMDQFSRALVKFLNTNFPDFNPSDLHSFSNELFNDEIKRDHELLVKLGKMDVAPFLQEMRNASEIHRKPVIPMENQDAEINKERVNVLDLGLDVPTENKAKGPRTITKIKVGKDSKGNLTNVQTSIDERNQQTQFKLRQQPGTSTLRRPKDATGLHHTKIGMDQEVTVTPKTNFSKVAGLFILLVVGLWKKDAILSYFPGGGEQAAIGDGHGDHDIASVADREGTLSLTGTDVFMNIYLNGEKVDYKGLGINLKLGKEYKIRVEKENFKAFESTVTLNSETDSVIVDVPPLKKEVFGEILSTGQYPEETVLSFSLEDKVIERPLPLDSYRLPAGKYEATIKNNRYKIEKKIQFEVLENQRSRID